MFLCVNMVALTAILTIVLLGISVSNAAKKKNVLFLVADDMRPQLNCYEGSDFPSPIHPKMHTPHIDALAARSLLLKRAHVQQAICSPSRTSLLTGRRPDTTHVYDLRTYFRDVGGNFTTIPEYFKLNGYVSAGMGKIFHHGRASGFDDPVSWSLPYFRPTRYWENYNSSWATVPDNMLKDKPLEDTQTAAKAMETLREFSQGGTHEGKPFFIAVGFFRPHLPFVVPQSFMDFYPEDEIKLPDNELVPIDMPEVAWSNNPELRMYADIAMFSGAINTTLPDDKVLALRRAYYSSVTWTDSLVGSVLKELESLGFANNTIVSFFGDHGYQLGEHGLWGKHTNFELATHAPMMVNIPGKTDGGIVTEELTEFVDLFPTLVDAAGLDPMPLCPEVSKDVALCREGESLMPLIENPSAPSWKKAAFSQHHRFMNGTSIMGYTVRTDRYRYTEWPRFTYAPDYKPSWDEVFGVELYDHRKDPNENMNEATNPVYDSVKVELRNTLRKGWRYQNIDTSFIPVG